jgi:protein gp37
MGVTSIEWTDRTWNPVSGCTRVSDGCLHCYIARTPPLRIHGRKFDRPGIGGSTGVELHDGRMFQPLSWRKPCKVFVCSLADLFHDRVPDEHVAKVWATMARAPRHTFQVLTKRPARMRSLLSSAAFAARVAQIIGGTADLVWPLPNVWCGTSTENQETAGLRIPILLDTPAAVHWISAEPLLGPLDVSGWLRPSPGCAHVGADGCCRHEASATPECHTGMTCPLTPAWHGLDWVVLGGESGPGARAMGPSWARSLRDQCASAAVPFLFKQWGGRTPKTGGRTLDERTWDEAPHPATTSQDALTLNQQFRREAAAQQCLPDRQTSNLACYSAGEDRHAGTDMAGSAAGGRS